MPLTLKGNEILNAEEKEYGEKKGKEVFYASKNAGKITGVDASKGTCSNFDSAVALYRNKQ